MMSSLSIILSTTVTLVLLLFPEPRETYQKELVTQAYATAAEEAGLDYKTLQGGVSDHRLWNGILQEYVDDKGRVDYQAMKKHQGDISTYIQSLSEKAPSSSWSRNEQLCYWINLYNALTVQLVLEHYPIRKITEINHGKPWDLPLVKIGDKELSLNHIEHNIIRKRYKEPRIHFAVNCAAKSCPKLLNQAYLPAHLEAQLKKQSLSFINNAEKNKFSKDGNQLSKIFDWYAEDFGGVIAFISRYKPGLNATAPLSYLEYDWSLNDRK